MTAKSIRVFVGGSQPYLFDWQEDMENALGGDWAITSGALSSQRGHAGSSQYLKDTSGGSYYAELYRQNMSFTTAAMWCYFYVPEFASTGRDLSITFVFDDECKGGPPSTAPDGRAMVCYFNFDTSLPGDSIGLLLDRAETACVDAPLFDVVNETHTIVPTTRNLYNNPAHWIGCKVVLTADNLKAYIDYGDNNSWTLMHSKSFSANLPTFTGMMISMESNDGELTNGIDDIYFSEQDPELQVGDFRPTLGEFYVEESNIGGGYLTVPDKNIDFADYYNKQEEEFIITDDIGTTLFTGLLDHPILMEDGVRFNVKEITQQLDERVCRRDYNLESGIVAEIGEVP